MFHPPIEGLDLKSLVNARFGGPGARIRLGRYVVRSIPQIPKPMHTPTYSQMES